ncbi:hypothetical protein FIBSPDRAFT_740782 [Athelia psychrophila]|uniref:Transmembrane protein n=1 Tax=Athelia psychrophila TaxID=1759441 RepID=A0A166JY35_9AGAM|nr:hypothetical protein FIBSPDRAFT_740782 [Fibularhizoctonia sp. CBS 109695]
MNRLRKSSTPSTIQQVPSARASASDPNVAIVRGNTPQHSAVAPTSGPSFESVRPKTSGEHYWAARALKAETRLTEGLVHNREVKGVRLIEDEKRKREVSALARRHEEREAKLEKLVYLLLAFLAFLVTVVSYLLYATSKQCVPQQSRWSLPSHFTIPILSPFASVVEHETSVFGAKVILACAALSAGLAYFMFRHWLARSKAP